jgi:hypothetical protein
MKNGAIFQGVQLLPRLPGAGTATGLSNPFATKPVAAIGAATPADEAAKRRAPATPNAANAENARNSYLKALYRQSARFVGPRYLSGANPLQSPALLATYSAQELAQRDDSLGVNSVNALAREQGSLAYRRAGAAPALFSSAPSFFQTKA